MVRSLGSGCIILIINLMSLLLGTFGAVALDTGSLEPEQPVPPTDHIRSVPPKPAGFGPFPRGYIDVNIPRPPVADVAARIYYPANATGSMTGPNMTGNPWPVIIFIPGGADTLGYCNPISERISSYGFVVVNVELGNTYGGGSLRDPRTMAQEVGDVIDYIENQTINVSYHLYGIMDKERVGVSGHSWGGAASGLAMTESYGDIRIKAGAPISSTPVLAANYTDMVDVPVGLLGGTSGDNDLTSLFRAGHEPITYVAVIGATHGGVLSYSEYVVAFFKYWLANETTYDNWIYTDGVFGDQAAGTISYWRNVVNLTVDVVPMMPVEDEMVNISGHISGLVYGVVDYEVNWADGSPIWKSNETNLTSYVFQENKTYNVKMRSKDMYETDEVVTPLFIANVPPSARISTNGSGNLTSMEDSVLFLDASGTMDTPTDLPNLTYSWDFGDGQQTDVSNITGTSHIYTKSGKYVANLSVVDGDWAQGNASVNVTVLNQPPTAKIGFTGMASEDSEVSFIGTANDTPSDLLRGFTYMWDFGDGNATAWATAPTASYTYTIAGNYSLTFKVKDDDGDVGNDTTLIRVMNVPPTGIILVPGPGETLEKDTPVQFVGEGSDTISDAPSLEYQWEFGDGNSTGWDPVPSAEHTYSLGGEYDVGLFTRDDNGDTGYWSLSITIENAPPVCTILGPAEGTSYDEDAPVAFTVKAEDTVTDIGSIVFEWDLGDGQTAIGQEVTRSFATTGEKVVKVTARDREGASSTCQVKVLVHNLPPEVDASAGPLEIQAGQSINFSANATDSVSDMASLIISWNFGDGTAIVREGNGTHTFADPGNYKVVFKAEDDDGEVAERSFFVTVTKGGGGGGGSGGGDEAGDDGSGLLLGIIAAGVAVAVVLAVLVLFLFRKRKQRTKGRVKAPDTEVGTGPQKVSATKK